MRGRVPIHKGHGNGLMFNVELGEAEGNEITYLGKENLPEHTHTASINVSSSNSTLITPTEGSSIGVAGSTSTRSFAPTKAFNEVAPNIALSVNSITINKTGESDPFPNRQPYLGMHWIICIRGIYPSWS